MNISRLEAVMNLKASPQLSTRSVRRKRDGECGWEGLGLGESSFVSPRKAKHVFVRARSRRRQQHAGPQQLLAPATDHACDPDIKSLATCGQCSSWEFQPTSKPLTLNPKPFKFSLSEFGFIVLQVDISMYLMSVQVLTSQAQPLS